MRACLSSHLSSPPSVAQLAILSLVRMYVCMYPCIVDGLTTGERNCITYYPYQQDTLSFLSVFSSPLNLRLHGPPPVRICNEEHVCAGKTGNQGRPTPVFELADSGGGGYTLNCERRHVHSYIQACRITAVLRASGTYLHTRPPFLRYLGRVVRPPLLFLRSSTLRTQQ